MIEVEAGPPQLRGRKERSLYGAQAAHLLAGLYAATSTSTHWTGLKVKEGVTKGGQQPPYEKEKSTANNMGIGATAAQHVASSHLGAMEGTVQQRERGKAACSRADVVKHGRGEQTKRQ